MLTAKSIGLYFLFGFSSSSKSHITGLGITHLPNDKETKTVFSNVKEVCDVFNLDRIATEMELVDIIKDLLNKWPNVIDRNSVSQYVNDTFSKIGHVYYLTTIGA